MQITVRVVALFACFILASMSAQAETYPSKPVRIVVPLPAGGAVDTIIRAVGQRLSEVWGHSSRHREQERRQHADRCRSGGKVGAGRLHAAGNR